MEVFFLPGKGGEQIDVLTGSFLQHISELIVSARDRGELSAETDISTATMAFWAFYSAGLGMGLRAEIFDVEAQVEMVECLLTQYFNINQMGEVT